MRKRFVPLPVLTFTALSFASSAPAAEVHLFVAASLKEAVNELADGRL